MAEVSGITLANLASELSSVIVLVLGSKFWLVESCHVTFRPIPHAWIRGHVTALDQSEFKSQNHHNYTTELPCINKLFWLDFEIRSGQHRTCGIVEQFFYSTPFLSPDHHRQTLNLDHSKQGRQQSYTKHTRHKKSLIDTDRARGVLQVLRFPHQMMRF